MKTVNEFELSAITDHLQKLGVTNFDARPGNNCVWVSYGVVNSYYIFKDGKIVDIQFD